MVTNKRKYRKIDLTIYNKRYSSKPLQTFSQPSFGLTTYSQRVSIVFAAWQYSQESIYSDRAVLLHSEDLYTNLSSSQQIGVPCGVTQSVTTKSTPVPPVTPVMSLDLIGYSGTSSQLRSSPDFLLSSLGNIVLLFSCSVLIVLHSQTYLQSEFQNSCYIPFWVIIAFMPHNCLIIFFLHRYIHSHEYIYKRIMYDRISSFINEVHPSLWTSSLLHLLQSTLAYLRDLRHFESGTTRSWGGTTHKLKPSPFHPTPVLQITPCIVLSLRKPR